MLESLRMEGCEMLGFMNDSSKNHAAIASMRRVTWSNKMGNENYEHFIHMDHCREDQFTWCLVSPWWMDWGITIWVCDFVIRWRTKIGVGAGAGAGLDVRWRSNWPCASGIVKRREKVRILLRERRAWQGSDCNSESIRLADVNVTFPLFYDLLAFRCHTARGMSVCLLDSLTVVWTTSVQCLPTIWSKGRQHCESGWRDWDSASQISIGKSDLLVHVIAIGIIRSSMDWKRYISHSILTLIFNSAVENRVQTADRELMEYRMTIDGNAQNVHHSIHRYRDHIKRLRKCWDTKRMENEKVQLCEETKWADCSPSRFDTTKALRERNRWQFNNTSEFDFR
jgi:hypothetical protein